MRGREGRRRLPSWRWEALRTTLWLVPTILIAVAGVLFVATIEIDVAAYHHELTLPFWIQTGSADAGRQVLIAIAAAVITVVGVVFSITILALTLASQQFGPRMMRNFVRDVGNQLTLGVFVATFVYSVLVLGSVISDPPRKLRTPPVDHRRRGAARRRRGRPRLLHPPHREVDPAARGDRRHRTRPDSGHRRRVPRAARPTEPDQILAAAGTVAELLELIEERGAGRPGELERLSAVRRVRAVGRHRRSDRRGHPARPPSGSLPRVRAAAGHGLASRRGQAGRDGARQGPRDRATPDPHAGSGVRHRSARRDRHPRALAGGERHLHRTHLHRLALGGSQQDLRPDA